MSGFWLGLVCGAALVLAVIAVAVSVTAFRLRRRMRPRSVSRGNAPGSIPMKR